MPSDRRVRATRNRNWYCRPPPDEQQLPCPNRTLRGISYSRHTRHLSHLLALVNLFASRTFLVSGRWQLAIHYQRFDHIRNLEDRTILDRTDFEAKVRMLRSIQHRFDPGRDII